jgi:hypothetical protein
MSSFSLKYLHLTLISQLNTQSSALYFHHVDATFFTTSSECKCPFDKKVVSCFKSLILQMEAYYVQASCYIYCLMPKYSVTGNISSEFRNGPCSRNSTTKSKKNRRTVEITLTLHSPLHIQPVLTISISSFCIYALRVILVVKTDYFSTQH